MVENLFGPVAFSLSWRITVSGFESGTESVDAKLRLPSENGTIRWFPRATAIVGAILLAAGAGIALFRPAILASSHAEINAAVHIYAGYLASRNLALAVLLLVALAAGARRALNSFLLLVAMVQLFDAVLDCVEGRWAVVPGVSLLALLFLLASASLSGYPFWKTRAWNDAA
jgi:hypothetical protein